MRNHVGSRLLSTNVPSRRSDEGPRAPDLNSSNTLCTVETVANVSGGNVGFGIYPIFDKKALRSPIESTGEALGAALELLEEWAERAGVPALTEFDGMHMEVPEDFDGDPEDLELPREEWRWFDPNEGLVSIKVFLSKAAKSKARVKRVVDPQHLLDDLESLKAALEKAATTGAKFQIVGSG
jgi:hypothetical protein